MNASVYDFRSDNVGGAAPELLEAIVAANAELSAAIQRSSALEKLHRLAREAGAVGTDRAVDFALKREGR